MKIIIPVMKYYPCNAIGANRWNNLSKLLANKYEVEIWTVKRKPYAEDIHKNIKVRNFKSDPMFLLEELAFDNLILRILKILLIKFLSVLFWPTDMGEYFPYFIKKEVLREIDNNSLFILTGGSFALQSKIFKYIYKKNHKNFILDFRDVWNTDPHRFYLFNFIKKRAENIEKSMLLSKNGKKLFVTNSLANSMISSVNNYEIILNGHDFRLNSIKDFKELFINKKNIKNIQIIYLGSIGKGRDSLFIEFIKKLNNLEKYIEVDIFGSISIKLRNFIFKYQNKYIKINNYKKINRDEIILISKNYNLGLQITSDSYPFALSTKLYEYPALCLPQICLCNNGEIKDMIRKNKIGEIINSQSTTDEVSKKINYSINQIEFEDLYKFAKESTWESRSKKLIQVIKSLQH